MMSWTIFFIILILLLTLAYGSYKFAPWVPTKSGDLKRILALADLRPGDVFYDLGCGTGKVVFAAAEIKGVKAVGVELFLPLYLYCLIKKWISGSSAEFECRDFFSKDLSGASVIYVFGTPRTLQSKLREKIWSEVKQGTKIISYVFEFSDLIPEGVSKPSVEKLSIRLYKV